MNDHPPGRIPCCVPFCRRTAAAERHPTSEEIICGKCWRRIPAPLRARRRALLRRSEKVNRLIHRRVRERRNFSIAQAERLESSYNALWVRNWNEMKAAAIEAAGGIGG